MLYGVAEMKVSVLPSSFRTALDGLSFRLPVDHVSLGGTHRSDQRTFFPPGRCTCRIGIAGHKHIHLECGEATA